MFIALMIVIAIVLVLLFGGVFGVALLVGAINSASRPGATPGRSVFAGFVALAILYCMAYVVYVLWPYMMTAFGY